MCQSNLVSFKISYKIVASPLEYISIENFHTYHKWNDLAKYTRRNITKWLILW